MTRRCQVFHSSTCPFCGRAGAEVIELRACACRFVTCACGGRVPRVRLWPSRQCRGCVASRMAGRLKSTFLFA